MKKGSTSFLIAGILSTVLIAAACSCGDDGSGTPSKSPSVSPPVGSVVLPTEEMKPVADVIVSHKLNDLKDGTDCLGCHKEGKPDTKHNDQRRMPMAPAYFSYLAKRDYKVVAGSTQDHTSYTNTQCFNSGCHVKPAS
ncbi:MAG: hypothetical protein FWC25_01880 [Dehalococcoidia bacterium]|nr:hypothetical protein [Dehalococcoidia bacterium]